MRPWVLAGSFLVMGSRVTCPVPRTGDSSAVLVLVLVLPRYGSTARHTRTLPSTSTSPLRFALRSTLHMQCGDGSSPGGPAVIRDSRFATRESWFVVREVGAKLTRMLAAAGKAVTSLEYGTLDSGLWTLDSGRERREKLAGSLSGSHIDYVGRRGRVRRTLQWASGHWATKSPCVG
ncbi:hypothetical protein L227DRAFT_89816 [Lentinus tigrinus ALCF2SS1-6]|uniref:Amine oxidase domain-containing protein n=1 Tax=Lentinus tigrinus ALCF2SS1-6 TaxID=1328759 RepID=A0A5C2SBL5_9APHY|nr:hypothetical protein L227DRAFT_89816 [Lentinus tigrinus ALCF2SS1-6]